MVKHIFLLLFIGNIHAQDIIYKFCNDSYANTIQLDLQTIQQDVAQQYPDLFYIDEAVYVTESYNGIIKITNLSSQPQIEVFCNQVQGISSFYEIAINSQEEIFISTGNNSLGSNIFKIDDMCYATPVFNNFNYSIQAMSFDKSDNLYVGRSSGSSTVWRADANNLSNFYIWYDFQEGNPSGDFVEKNGFFYIAWNINGTDYLYKVTLDADKQYVSHENLGAIRNSTFGLANEYGILYGQTPTSLYRIDENTLQTTTVINNPSNSSSRRWWGAAGLHEAIEVNYSFYTSQTDAENSQNPLSSPYEVSTDINHTIYVRIDNVTTGEYYIYPIQIYIYTPPIITLPEIIQICSGDSALLDCGVSEAAYRISWFKDGSYINGENRSTLTVYDSGIYQVKVNFPNFNCEVTASTEVETSDVEITSVNVAGNTANVTAVGSLQPFEYSLDGVVWQTNSEFTSLESGVYLVKARNALGCESNRFQFIIGNSNTITPNNDGINDAFHFPYLNDYSNAIYSIYDKYGKVLVEAPLSINSTWNGYYMGRALPTDTYWYQVKQKGQLLLQGYILIKNYE